MHSFYSIFVVFKIDMLISSHGMCCNIFYYEMVMLKVDIATNLFISDFSILFWHSHQLKRSLSIAVQVCTVRLLPNNYANDEKTNRNFQCFRKRNLNHCQVISPGAINSKGTFKTFYMLHTHPVIEVWVCYLYHNC